MSSAPAAVLYLREHREAAGVGVLALARATGLARTTVYRLESGAFKGIEFATLGALAHALGLAPGALFAPPAGPAKAKPSKSTPAKATRRA